MTSLKVNKLQQNYIMQKRELSSNKFHLTTTSSAHELRPRLTFDIILLKIHYNNIIIN